MKTLWKIAKPAAGALCLCLLLALAQAGCELALPWALGDLVTGGVQWGGLAAVAPEAVSLQGMTLLQTFLDEDDRESLGNLYYTIRPGSTEADRLAADYPLARENVICLRREGLTAEESAQADRLYALAADALTRYLAQAQETGELEATAQRFQAERQKSPGAFRSNVRDLTKTESSLPEGVIGKIPADALFTMPGKDPASQAPESAQEGGESPDGEDEEEESQQAAEESPAAQAPALAVDLSAGVAGMEAEQLYTLLPLLAQTEPGTAREAIRQAAAAAQTEPDRGPRLGVALKATLYRELGVDTAGLRRRAIWAGLWRLLGLTALDLVLAGGAWLARARAAGKAGQALRRALVARGETVTGGARAAQRLLAQGAHGLCFAPVTLAGAVILAWREHLTPGGAALALGAGLLAAGLALCGGLEPPALAPLARREQQLRRRLGPWGELPAAFLTPAGLLAVNAVCVAFALMDSKRVAGAALPVGARMAVLAWSVLAALCGLLMAWALWGLPRRLAAAKAALGEGPADGPRPGA